MENDKNKQKKRNKIIIIVIIILLLFLMLIKLYFEFRLERERLEELKAGKSNTEQEADGRKKLIDSLCSIYPDECDNFEKFGNVGNILNYANSLFDKQKLNSIRDSLCFVDSINCDKCKNFTELDDFIRCLDSLKNEQMNNKSQEQQIADSIKRENLLKLQREGEISDSINQANLNSLIDSLCKVYPEDCDNCKKHTNLDDFRRCLDSLKNQREQEIADSIANAGKNAKICNDTIAPWVYPEPTGGLYFEPIKVSFFVSEKNASVFYKYSKDAEFRLWDGEIISISQNTELFYYATDTCDNIFEEQKKVYEFRERQVQNICPVGMAFVETPQGNFCIDQFEWGNKKGIRPANMVSQAQARDSCAAIGKRLCTADEWAIACKGPYNWKYPYGNNYIRHACITQDSTYRRSGEAGECRGWYAIYDMTGNLAEWTSTRSEENNRFFVVKGGFWESGASATCEMSRYSYYPQNQHTPVGFRCCQDLE